MYQAPTTPINYPCGIANVILPGIQSFTSVDDFKQNTGVAPPKYDPDKPVKMWRDTVIDRANPAGLTNANRGRQYLVISREIVMENGIPVAGVPQVEPAFVPGWWAMRVNIPGPSEGAGNADVLVQEFQFPVIETLTNAQVDTDQSPFGIVVVAPQ